MKTEIAITQCAVIGCEKEYKPYLHNGKKSDICRECREKSKSKFEVIFKD